MTAPERPLRHPSRAFALCLRLSFVSAFAVAAPSSALDHRPSAAMGYTVATANGDLVARRNDGSVAFSARAFADAQHAALAKMLGTDLKTVSHRFSVVSLAGPLLAIRDDVDLNEAAPIPGGSTRYWTIDLRQAPTYDFADKEPLQPAPNNRTLLDLRLFYSPTTLARAIGATKLGARGATSPVSRDLRYVLSDLSKRGLGTSHCFGADPDILSSFALTGVAARRVHVQLGIPGQASCRHNLTPLDIALPRSKALPAAVVSKPIGSVTIAD